MTYDWLSFLTDYGSYDGFVAACHGSIARIAPQVRVVDVTHDVPPGDIRRGAAVLAQNVPYLPTAVHVAVVDPGVGTARRGIALRAPGGVLVGPDNGLLGWAAAVLGGIEVAVSLTDPAYHLAHVRSTFHGRDVFAPVGAHLASGVNIRSVGEPVDPDSLVRLPDPVLRTGPDRIETEVLTLDRYGNVQTPATEPFPVGATVEVTAAGRTHRMPQVVAFGDVPAGTLLSYVDSYGMVAVAVNGGSAADALGVGPGDPIVLRRVTGSVV